MPSVHVQPVPSANNTELISSANGSLGEYTCISPISVLLVNVIVTVSSSNVTPLNVPFVAITETPSSIVDVETLRFRLDPALPVTFVEANATVWLYGEPIIADGRDVVPLSIKTSPSTVKPSTSTDVMNVRLLFGVPSQTIVPVLIVTPVPRVASAA